MAEVGDRVEVMSRKGGPRSGVVTEVSGVMITVRWESGTESSLVPGPGALQIVSAKSATKPAAKSPTKTPSKKRAKGAKKTR